MLDYSMEMKPKSYLKLSEAYPEIQVDLGAIKLAELIMLSREQRNKQGCSSMSGTNNGRANYHDNNSKARRI